MKIFARWLVNLEKSVISVGIVFLFQAVHSQSLQVPNNAFLLSEGNVGRKDGPYIGKAMSAESCESLAVLGLAASDHANRHLHVTACKEWFAKPKPASIARLEAISTDCDNAPDFSHTHHQSMRRDVVATCKRYMANPHSVREVSPALMLLKPQLSPRLTAAQTQEVCANLLLPAHRNDNSMMQCSSHFLALDQSKQKTTPIVPVQDLRREIPTHILVPRRTN